MLLESILILFISLLILVFFYKQSNHDFNILQVESLPKALSVLHERSPVVVYPFDTHIRLWTRQDLSKRPSILQLRLQNTTLNALLNQEEKAVLSKKESIALANVVGISLIVKNEIFQIFRDTLWWSPLLTVHSEALIGPQGLRITYAHTTLVFTTEGSILVSLLNGASSQYLPQMWKGKRLKTLTRDEAPHLDKIQYVDVIIRPGSLLMVPPHWKICWESYENPKVAPLIVFVEIHHPISRLIEHSANRV